MGPENFPCIAAEIICDKSSPDVRQLKPMAFVTQECGGRNKPVTMIEYVTSNVSIGAPEKRKCLFLSRRLAKCIGKMTWRKMAMKFMKTLAMAGLGVSLMAGPAIGATLSINGSTTVLPIVQKVGEAFMKEHPGTTLSISGGGSGNGIKAIIDGTTDVAMSSRFIRDSEVKLAVERGSYPVPFAVSYDCIVPVVHTSNTVNDISLEQLKAIYRGEIRNWKEIGGPDRPVVVISRDTSSGTYEVWDEKVMNKERVFPGALLQASSGAVHQSVSRNRNAIGYLGIGYLDDSVKALTVEGIEGNVENTLNNKFPVARPLYVFTRGWPTGDTLTFINYMLHPQKGQKHVQEAGFVPLY